MLTQADITLIKQAVVDITAPMFEMIFERFDRLEGRMDRLEARMDGLEARMSGLEARMSGLEARMSGLEGRMDRLESEFRDFKASVEARLAALEEKVTALQETYASRFDNVEEDVRMLYHLVEKLEKGTKEEKIFAEKVIVENLPTIYKALQIIAKKHNIKLPA